jgi:transcriptional regulator with XRE-family HTH domain
VDLKSSTGIKFDVRKKHPLLIQVGDNLRRLRLEAGFSQEGLGLETGLDRTYIGGIERGERNVSVLNLCKIALAIGKRPEDLLANLTLDIPPKS